MLSQKIGFKNSKAEMTNINGNIGNSTFSISKNMTGVCLTRFFSFESHIFSLNIYNKYSCSYLASKKCFFFYLFHILQFKI